MTKKVTLSLDDDLVRRCRRQAVHEGKSLSRWVTDLMTKALPEEITYAGAKKKALRVLKRGFSLGGTPMLRDDLHERQ